MEEVRHVEDERYKKSQYLPFNFAVNLKLLFFKKVCKNKSYQEKAYCIYKTSMWTSCYNSKMENNRRF
jgi:hypothetical protein